MLADLETVRFAREGAVTFVTLHRPDKRNALDPQLNREMDRAIDLLELDEQTRVVVLTGAGIAFSAGMDMKAYADEIVDSPEKRYEARRAAVGWRWQKLIALPKPTIAMVNGACYGGALTAVCACDFAFAADEARFCLSEIDWGVIPGGLLSWNLNQSMSHRDAMYYACTGAPFDGRKAAELRFVNASAPLASLREMVLTLAGQLLDKDPLALRYTIEAVRATRTMTPEAAADYLGAKQDALRYHGGGQPSAAMRAKILDRR